MRLWSGMKWGMSAGGEALGGCCTVTTNVHFGVKLFHGREAGPCPTLAP